jgi:hypothetical protein
MPDVYPVLIRVLSIVWCNTVLIIIKPQTRPPWTPHEVRRFLRKVVSHEMQAPRRVQIAVLVAMTGISREHL